MHPDLISIGFLHIKTYGCCMALGFFAAWQVLSYLCKRIKVQYVVDGKIYAKRKWIGAGKEVPAVGSNLTVLYCSNKPSKAKIL